VWRVISAPCRFCTARYVVVVVVVVVVVRPLAVVFHLCLLKSATMKISVDIHVFCWDDNPEL